TPLAMAIIEKKVGDVVVVPVQPPYEVEILKIK
ncbi:MAG TPA: transcription elongation factor GreA, partial [Erysipelothrix sp.]|nr:transcription elongation factor GreA [Erysipelothrix sp.]